MKRKRGVPIVVANPIRICLAPLLLLQGIGGEPQSTSELQWNILATDTNKKDRNKKKPHCINRRPVTQSELPLKRAANGGAKSLNEENDATNPLINKQ